MAILYWDGNGPYPNKTNSGGDRVGNGVWSTSIANWSTTGYSRGVVDYEDWSSVLNPGAEGTFSPWSNGNTPEFRGEYSPSITISGTVQIADINFFGGIEPLYYIMYQDRWRNAINQEIFEYVNYFGAPYPLPPTEVSPNPDWPNSSPQYFWNGPRERKVYSVQSTDDAGTPESVTISEGTMSLNANCNFYQHHYVPVRTSKVTINSLLAGTTWYKTGAGTLVLTNPNNTARLTSIVAGTVKPTVSGALGQTATTVDLYGQLFLDSFYDLNVSVNVYGGVYKKPEDYVNDPFGAGTSQGLFEIPSGSCGLNNINIVEGTARIDIKQNASLYVKNINIANGNLEIFGDGNLTVENINFTDNTSNNNKFVFSGRGTITINGDIVGNVYKKFIFNSHKGERLSSEANFYSAGEEDQFNTSELKINNETSFAGTIELRKGKFYIQNERAIANASVYNYNNSEIYINANTASSEATVYGKIYLLTKFTEDEEPLRVLNTGSVTIQNLYLYYEGRNQLVNDINSVYGNYNNYSSNNSLGGKVKIIKSVSSGFFSPYNYLKINNLFAYHVSGSSDHTPTLLLTTINTGYTNKCEFILNNVSQISSEKIRNIDLLSGRIKFVSSGNNVNFDFLNLKNTYEYVNTGSVIFNYTGSVSSAYAFNIDNDFFQTYNYSVDQYGASLFSSLKERSINVSSGYATTLTGYIKSPLQTIAKIGGGKLIVASSGTTNPQYYFANNVGSTNDVYNYEDWDYCFPNNIKQDSLIRTLNIRNGILAGSSSFEQYSTASHALFTSWFPGSAPITKNWDNISINTSELTSEKNVSVRNGWTFGYQKSLGSKIGVLNTHRLSDGNKKVGLDNLSGKRTTINVFSGSSLEICNLNLCVNSLNNYGTIYSSSPYTASILVGYGRDFINTTATAYSGSAFYYYELNDKTDEGYTDEYELKYKPELRRYIKKKIWYPNVWFVSAIDICGGMFGRRYENNKACWKNNGTERVVPGDPTYKDCKLSQIISRGYDAAVPIRTTLSYRSTNINKDSVINGAINENIQLVFSNRSLLNLKFSPVSGNFSGGLVFMNTLTDINSYQNLGNKIITITSDPNKNYWRETKLNFNSNGGYLNNDIAIDGDGILSFNKDNAFETTVSGNIYIYGTRERNRVYSGLYNEYLNYLNSQTYNENLRTDAPKITNNTSPFTNKYLNIYGNLLAVGNQRVDIYNSNIKLYSTSSNVSEINVFETAITLQNNNALPNCTIVNNGFNETDYSYLNLNGYNQELANIRSNPKYIYDKETCQYVRNDNKIKFVIYNNSLTSSNLTLNNYDSSIVKFGHEQNNTNSNFNVILLNQGYGDNLYAGVVNSFTCSSGFISNNYSITTLNGFRSEDILQVRKKLAVLGSIYARNISYEFNNASITTSFVNLSGSNPTIFANGNAEITGNLSIGTRSYLRFQK